MATVWAPLGPECGDGNEVCSRHFGVDEMPVAAWARGVHLHRAAPYKRTSPPPARGSGGDEAYLYRPKRPKRYKAIRSGPVGRRRAAAIAASRSPRA
jgi:hypothetical protein